MSDPVERPPDAAVRGLLLAHGAGSDRGSPSLVAIEEAVAPLPVVRMNFPYREREGRRPPDRAPVLVASVREHLDALCERVGAPSDRIVLGGRSMGGRMCSMLAAGATGATVKATGDAELVDPVPVAGLALVSYPLHPPGKPDRLRVEHFGRLDVPCLFVSGTRDPFGAPDELEAHTATIPGPVTHVWIEGKGHDLKGCDQRVADEVASWLRSL